MARSLKEYIEDGTIQELTRIGVVPITVTTKIYLWERVQMIRDERPEDTKMSAVQTVALECKLDDSTVLRAYNTISKIV